MFFLLNYNPFTVLYLRSNIHIKSKFTVMSKNKSQKVFSFVISFAGLVSSFIICFSNLNLLIVIVILLLRIVVVVLLVLPLLLHFVLVISLLFWYKKTSPAGIEPAIPRSVVWCVSIAPQALQYIRKKDVSFIKLSKLKSSKEYEWNV